MYGPCTNVANCNLDCPYQHVESYEERKKRCEMVAKIREEYNGSRSRPKVKSPRKVMSPRRNMLELIEKAKREEKDGDLSNVYQKTYPKRSRESRGKPDKMENEAVKEVPGLILELLSESKTNTADAVTDNTTNTIYDTFTTVVPVLDTGDTGNIYIYFFFITRKYIYSPSSCR